MSTMGLPPDFSVASLAAHIFEYVRRGASGACQTLCLRKHGRAHVQPSAHQSFAEDTRFVPYEVAVKTSIPDGLIEYVLYKVDSEDRAESILLENGRLIRIVNRTSELNHYTAECAVIIREDDTVVVWSHHVQAIMADYHAVEHGLRHYVGACTCSRLLSCSPSKIQPQSSEQVLFDYALESICEGGDFIASHEQAANSGSPSGSGLMPLPELVHLHGLHGSKLVGNPENQHLAHAAMTAPVGDTFITYPYFNQLPGIYELPSSYLESAAFGGLSPTSSPPWSSSSASSASTDTTPLSVISDICTPQTVCLADISPPPPILTIAELEVEIQQSADASSDLSLSLHGTSRSSSPQADVNDTTPFSRIISSSIVPASIPTFQENLNEKAGPIHSCRSRIRTSSVEMTTVLPCISRAVRKRRATSATSERAAPYSVVQHSARTKTTASPNRVAAQSKSKPGCPRKAFPKDEPAPGASMSTASASPPADDLSDLSDIDEAESSSDEDDEYRARGTTKKRGVPKPKPKPKRRKRRSSAGKKSARDKLCGYNPEGCSEKFTRMSDRWRHMMWHCTNRPSLAKDPNALCRECGYNCARPDSLRRHIRGVHNIAESVFPLGYIEAKIVKGEIPDFRALNDAEVAIVREEYKRRNAAQGFRDVKR